MKKTIYQIRREMEEWNNRLKNCQCHKPLHTKWGSDYKINQIYKYTILTYEELIERNDCGHYDIVSGTPFQMNKPVVINHNKGTDRFTIPDFNEHFTDFQTLRDNKISIILNLSHETYEKDTL